jgi:hypothetical protein
MNLLEESRYLRLEGLLVRLCEAVERLGEPEIPQQFNKEEAFIDEISTEDRREQETEDEYLDRISMGEDRD